MIKIFGLYNRNLVLEGIQLQDVGRKIYLTRFFDSHRYDFQRENGYNYLIKRNLFEKDYQKEVIKIKNLWKKYKAILKEENEKTTRT